MAFCGLECGRCIKGSGKSSASANQILGEIQVSHLDSWQAHEPRKEQFSYEDMKKGLRWIASLDCAGCHAESCNPECEIRKCAMKKGVANCSKCPQMPCDIVRHEKERGGVDVKGNFGRKGKVD